ncbi:MAG: hypothetical protein KBD44_02485 [Candidatus Pacebacteria bacterium]|nr:hypothetical protein [Candidatus Paceibacterota bacterium]
MLRPAQPKNRQATTATPLQSGDNTEGDGGSKQHDASATTQAQQQAGSGTATGGQQAGQPLFKDWASI